VSEGALKTEEGTMWAWCGWEFGRKENEWFLPMFLP